MNLVLHEALYRGQARMEGTKRVPKEDLRNEGE
jgi:hypothetical protein